MRPLQIQSYAALDRLPGRERALEDGKGGGGEEGKEGGVEEGKEGGGEEIGRAHV